MLKSNQFTVNEAWIVVKVNDTSLPIQNEQYDVFVIMDAASTYVLGQALSKTADVCPSIKEVQDMFMTGWGAKKMWPKKLIIPDNMPDINSFRLVAKENKIAVECLPIKKLLHITNPVKESFNSLLSEKQTR